MDKEILIKKIIAFSNEVDNLTNEIMILRKQLDENETIENHLSYWLDYYYRVLKELSKHLLNLSNFN